MSRSIQAHHKQAPSPEDEESGFSWPDVLLVGLLIVAAVAAFFQILPSVWFAVIDIGHWPLGVWIGINVLVIVMLVILRARRTG